MPQKNLPASKEMFSDASTAAEVVARKEELVKSMTEATVAGLAGDTFFDGSHESGDPKVSTRAAKRREFDRIMAEMEMSKSVDPAVQAALTGLLSTPKADSMVKEWTLTNPVSTGLVPYDLEAPAKLLTPRPTPLRNSISRQPGKGSARRFKVVSGFTGTGTGGIGTLQPGITESTTNSGPGGLSYIRPPYITYGGYDVTLNYVSWGLSDSVSWQAEYEGQGFQDIRSLSNTALLYATMLMDERLMLYGRGTTANNYVGPLAAASITSLAAVAASVAGVTSTTLTNTTYWVVVAGDAGDLLGTTGAFHQGPTSAASSVAISGSTQAIQVNITPDVVGALGYNLFVGSVVGGPFAYAGRTGYDTGYITAPPNTANGTATASAADASAVSTNFDGLMTNIAASGGYVKRLNGLFSTTTPGTELQSLFSSVFDSVKADPDEIWLNGHDRNQLSNALLSGSNVNNYGVRFFNDAAAQGVTVGSLVQGVVNQITGKELNFNVHPWMPQGNLMVRSVTLPIPDTNVNETSVMTMVQDYVAIQWPVQQFTYDASTLEIGTFTHYAPGWNGVIQGIQLSG
jgi:hypothetical protein